MPLFTTIYKGRKYSLPITYSVDGTPADITTDTFVLMIKKRVSLPDESAVLEKAATPVSAMDGTMLLELEPADTVNIPSGEYVYDFVRIDTDSKPYTMEQSDLTIETPVNKTPVIP